MVRVGNALAGEEAAHVVAGKSPARAAELERAKRAVFNVLENGLAAFDAEVGLDVAQRQKFCGLG